MLLHQGPVTLRKALRRLVLGRLLLVPGPCLLSQRNELRPIVLGLLNVSLANPPADTIDNAVSAESGLANRVVSGAHGIPRLNLSILCVVSVRNDIGILCNIFQGKFGCAFLAGRAPLIGCTNETSLDSSFVVSNAH